MGDVLAHAALPGVGVAFLLTGSKEPPPSWPEQRCRRSLDLVRRLHHPALPGEGRDGARPGALVFFGIGVVLLTWIQRRGFAARRARLVPLWPVGGDGAPGTW